MVAHVCALEVDLFVPDARSLKDRRRALRPVVDRLRARHQVAIAETAGADTWQTATLTVVSVASSATIVERALDDAERAVWSRDDLEVTDARRTWMEL